MGFSDTAPEKKQEAAPVAQAPAASAPAVDSGNIIAAIAAAVAACTGGGQIACINRLSGNASWTSYSRIEATTTRNQMF